jgi:hypothetical protein
MDFDSAYILSMPTNQDLEGDIMATVIINSGLLENPELSLGEVLEIAYDPEGKIYPNRFKLFADAIELEVDPKTGEIINSKDFEKNNLKFVKAYGIGLYSKPIFEDILEEMGILDDIDLENVNTEDINIESILDEIDIDDIKTSLDEVNPNIFSEYIFGLYSKKALDKFIEDIQKGLWLETGSTAEGSNE